MNKKIVLTTRGSRGDVYPIVEITSRLKQRNYKTSICVPAFFKNHAEGHGLNPSLFSEDSELLMAKLGHGLKAAKTALKWFAASVEEQFEFMLKESEDADLIVTTSTEIVAPTIAEYRKIPYVRIAYTPLLPGKQPPPLFPWQKMPTFANRILWEILNSSASVFIKKFVNKKRRLLGLKRIKSGSKYLTDLSHTVFAINEDLAPPCESWEGKYVYDYTGYCYGNIYGELDPELNDFLKSGEKPIYIGFGSVNIKNANDFTSIVLEAAKKTKSRVILLKGWTKLGFDYPHDTVFVADNVPHLSLFPHVLGVIHHGGSGTTHSTAKSGVPQAIFPQLGDQYYWGHRTYTMGLGPEPIAPKKVSVEKLCKIFDSFRYDDKFSRTACELGEKMKHEDGTDKVIKIIESYL